MKNRHPYVIGVACLALLGLFTAGLAGAASIPTWLDDAITKHNDENKGRQITFSDIKDSFVWYMVADTEEIGSKDIRDVIYSIAEANRYKATSEELVTAAKPPSTIAPYKEKKCWKRSFVLDEHDVSAPGRMLTTYVCEDGPNWFAGFRVLQ